MKVFIFALLFCLKTIYAGLTFELRHHDLRCFIEELFQESVASVKWKIRGGLPDGEKRQGKFC
jgi:hypothetical protein